MLHFPTGQGFSLYSMAALLPLLPAKQRASHANDWMSTDSEVACPDPNCPTRFRITRLQPRRFEHSQTTAVALKGQQP
jgi:uncharacterized repeat protein (TIGR04076 family)